MTRETKVGLLIGMGVILLIGIIVSDTLTSAVTEETPDLPGFGAQSQDSIFRATPQDAYASRDRLGEREPVRRRQHPVPTPGELDSRPRDLIDVPTGQSQPRSVPRQLPTALSLDRMGERDIEAAGRPFVGESPAVPTLRLSHDWEIEPSQRTASAGRGTADGAADLVERRGGSASTTPARSMPAEPVGWVREARVASDGDRGRGSDIIHYVQRGETLYDIARKYYGAGSYWRSLAEVNRDVVDTEGRVVENARLVIPNRAGLARLDGFEPAGVERTMRVERVQPRSQPQTVEVATGDTLSSLASRHLGSASRWRELLAANSDQLETATDLQAGMKLRLPGAATSDVAPASAQAGAERRQAPPTNRQYTVRTGDTLTRIAQRELGDGGRWREIYEANRDQLSSPDSVKVGQTLRLPG